MKNYKMIPKITLWSLLALGIVFIALFFLGGSNGSLEVAGDFLDIPRFTDAFLIWNYILFGVVVLITLGVVCVDFANNWKTNRRKAYMTLGVVGGFILLALICWFLGSPEKINIIGYEGTDNEGAWAQLADAVIYACYFLFIATIGTMIWGYVHKTVEVNHIYHGKESPTDQRQLYGRHLVPVADFLLGDHLYGCEPRTGSPSACAYSA